MIKSHLLYQLSYAPGTGPESLRKRASFSKATPRCPARRRVIPRPSRRVKTAEKPPDPGGFSQSFRAPRRLARLEPVRAIPVTMTPARAALAIVAMIPIAAHHAAAAHHAVLEAMVPPAAAESAPPVRQHGKAPLLALV